MDWLTNPEIWIALATLTALEVVLGIDNVVFISILAGKLPAARCARLCSSNALLAPLASLCGRTAGTSRAGGCEGDGCELCGGKRAVESPGGAGRVSFDDDGAGAGVVAGDVAGGRDGADSDAHAAARAAYASNALSTPPLYAMMIDGSSASVL